MLKTQLETDVTEYYRSVYRSVINVETEVLRDVFDDGFVFTNISGEEFAKEEFIASLENETINVFSENIERIYVKKDGDILNVRGRSKVNVSLDGAKRRIRKIQVDLVLKKTEEGRDEETGDLRPELTRWRVLSAEADIY